MGVFIFRDFSEIYRLSNRSLRGTFHGSTSNIFLPFGKKGPASFPAVSRAKKANLTIKTNPFYSGYRGEMIFLHMYLGHSGYIQKVFYDGICSLCSEFVLYFQDASTFSLASEL